jgi:hypothetical protein
MFLWKTTSASPASAALHRYANTPEQFFKFDIFQPTNYILCSILPSILSSCNRLARIRSNELAIRIYFPKKAAVNLLLDIFELTYYYCLHSDSSGLEYPNTTQHSNGHARARYRLQQRVVRH